MLVLRTCNFSDNYHINTQKDGKGNLSRTVHLEVIKAVFFYSYLLL